MKDTASVRVEYTQNMEKVMICVTRLPKIT